MKADELRITVKTSEKSEHKASIISEVGVYRAAADFALGNGIPEGLEIIEDTSKDFTFSGSWENDTGEAYTGGTERWANPGNATAGATDATFTITPNEGYTVKDVKVNGTSVDAVTTYIVKNVSADVAIERRL